MRPLVRRRTDQAIAATPPDQVMRWTERGNDGDRTLHAEPGTGRVLPDAAPGRPTCTVVARYDPASAEPLLVATPLALTPPLLRALDRDRWPVEQLPVAATQRLGAARQVVHAQATCQRVPELALLAGAGLTYAAATSPAVPTGAWDRQPRRTPGRLRRRLSQAACPTDFPWPERLRGKVAVTDHLPKGWWGQRRPPSPTAPSSGTPANRSTSTAVA